MNWLLVIFKMNQFCCRLFFLKNLFQFMHVIVNQFHFIQIWVFLFHNLRKMKMLEFLYYQYDFNFLNLLYLFDEYDLMSRFLKKENCPRGYHQNHFQNKAFLTYDHLLNELMATDLRFFILLKFAFYYFRILLIFHWI